MIVRLGRGDVSDSLGGGWLGIDKDLNLYH